MDNNLITELIELSAKVKAYNTIDTCASITPSIELSGNMELPYVINCEALHPGIFKGFTILREEILAAMDTIFDKADNIDNSEVNKDHKNALKEDSSVDDLIGKVVATTYDHSQDAFMLRVEIYDESTALKIHNGLLKYVSLRIEPEYIDYIGDKQIARNLHFRELSIVRRPGDPNAKILR